MLLPLTRRDAACMRSEANLLQGRVIFLHGVHHRNRVQMLVNKSAIQALDYASELLRGLARMVDETADVDENPLGG